MKLQWLEFCKERKDAKTPCDSQSQRDPLEKSWAVLIQILSGPANVLRTLLELASRKPGGEIYGCGEEELMFTR